MLKHEKILITGPSGQVARPLAVRLAKDNEVYGLARFRNPSVRQGLEDAGVRCLSVDLRAGDLRDVPNDFTLVLNFGVAKTQSFDDDLAANVEAIGFLMHHCRGARAFLHCSSTAVYEPNGHTAMKETDRLGDNHKAFGFMPTYSICKIAAESMARFGARQYGLPTVIARLSVPYGDAGGWPLFHLEMMRRGHPIPVHTNAPSIYNPIHEDDIFAQVPKLLAVASVPATTLNWAGRDAVSIEEWCTYMGELTGLEPRFQATPTTIESVCCDTARMHALIGATAVGWRDGLRRMLEARCPELLRG